MFEVRVVFKLRVNTENIDFQAPKSQSTTRMINHTLSQKCDLVQLIGSQFKIVLDNSSIFRLERSKIVDKVRPVNMLQRS